jgi:hypothetical protein
VHEHVGPGSVVAIDPGQDHASVLDLVANFVTGAEAERRRTASGMVV